MRILYVDPIGGLSGDMFLGALVDLGWPLASLERELQEIGISDIRLDVETRIHRHLSSKGILVTTGEKGVHRHLPDIEKILGVDRTEMDAIPPHRRKAYGAFRRLVEAEARIHGQPIEKVHLHEVGGLDSIADILGVCLAISDLEIERVFVGPLPLGTGWVDMAHGRFPIPAPATVEILKDVPVVWTGECGEKVTPTGAVLAVTLADQFGFPPPMILRSTGWGGGSRPTAEGETPNLVRLILGETEDEAVNEAGEGLWDRVGVLTTHIDDMTSEEMAYLTEKLRIGGALDVFVTPGLMKKGRPAWALTVLCGPAMMPSLRTLLFEESSTLGIRIRWEERWVLNRLLETLETPYGPIQVKWARRGERWEAAPEFESLKSAADSCGISLRKIALEISRLLPEVPKTSF